ncbi:MAG: hypothetical protein U0794_10935 [Isosphaeraceae bacterium]
MGRRRDARGWKPQVESLETLDLPSALPVSAVPPMARAAVHALFAPIRSPLTGSIQGYYAGGSLNREGGSGIRIAATGRLTQVGTVVITGSLQPAAFVARGTATGTLTVRNSQGSVTLALRGPIQPAFSALPDQLAFDVISGTGRYADLQATGTVSIQLGPDTDPGSSSRVSAGGPVSLSFHPGATLPT